MKHPTPHIYKDLWKVIMTLSCYDDADVLNKSVHEDSIKYNDSFNASVYTEGPFGFDLEQFFDFSSMKWLRVSEGIAKSVIREKIFEQFKFTDLIGFREKVGEDQIYVSIIRKDFFKRFFIADVKRVFQLLVKATHTPRNVENINELDSLLIEDYDDMQLELPLIVKKFSSCIPTYSETQYPKNSDSKSVEEIVEIYKKVMHEKEESDLIESKKVRLSRIK